MNSLENPREPLLFFKVTPQYYAKCFMFLSILYCENSRAVLAAITVLEREVLVSRCLDSASCRKQQHWSETMNKDQQ
jgi:hypothetical protein